MIIDGKEYTQIVVTTDKTAGELVTADDRKEVIAIISDDARIVVKKGYEVKAIPAGGGADVENKTLEERVAKLEGKVAELEGNQARPVLGRIDIFGQLLREMIEDDFSKTPKVKVSLFKVKT